MNSMNFLSRVEVQPLYLKQLLSEKMCQIYIRITPAFNARYMKGVKRGQPPDINLLNTFVL